MFLTGKLIISLWSPEGKVCGEVYSGDTVEVRFMGQKGIQDETGSVRGRSPAATRTPRHIPLPVSLGIFLTGIIIIHSWGREGKVAWLCLCLRELLLARLDEMFVTDPGPVHSVH